MKDEIRHWAKNIRAKQALGENEKASLEKNILSIVKPAPDMAVAGYVPVNNEIDISFMLAHCDPYLLPVITGHSLRFVKFADGDAMVKNVYGIPEPAKRKYLDPDYILVPLVAFDERCNRIGYGGGYFDRTLEVLRKERPIKAIGIAYDAQKWHDPLPIEATDQVLDFIVTPKTVYSAR